MIYDKLSNIGLYQLPDAVFKAVEQMKDLPVGKHGLNDGIICLQQAYATRSENLKIESHRKYVDLQYIAGGHEKIGLDFELEPDGNYNDEKDVIFYKGEPKNYISVSAGEFALFFPHDIHMPAMGNGEQVKKVVLKIPVTLFSD